MQAARARISISATANAVALVHFAISYSPELLDLSEPHISWYTDSTSNLGPLLQTVVVAVVAIVMLAAARWLLEKRVSRQTEGAFRIQIIMLALTVAAVVGGILALPISDTTRAQLLSLLGILLSAAIALSSTTFLGNIMAGMMLRAVRPFKGGDFIRIGEHFGRVSERELFHIEIQTADRDLTTLPNLYVVTNPFTVVRKSGTIVSTRLSLGYDVPRTRVEDLLLEAASRAGLDKPFVQIVELGDFSVTYRIAGLCTEVDQMLSTRSRLRASVMDVLHEGDVEIVSPEFRNLRNLESDRAIIPEAAARSRARESEGDGPEAIVFDKAAQAAAFEAIRKQFAEMGKAIETLKVELKTAQEPTKAKLERRLERLEAGRARLTEYLATAAELDDED